MRRGAVAVGAAALAGVLLLVGGGAAAAATSIVDVGWWTRSPGQRAPKGGFAVAEAPDGPTTVAALRLDLGSTGVQSAEVEAVETGGLNADGAAIEACVVTAGWEEEAAGDLDDAPADTCENQSVAFERDGDAETWTADLTPLLRGRTGRVSLAIVPAEPEGDLPAVGFEVRLARPVLHARPAAAPPPTAPTAPAASPAPQSEPVPSTATAGDGAPSVDETVAPSSVDGSAADTGGSGATFDDPTVTSTTPTTSARPRPTTPTTAGTVDEAAAGAYTPLSDELGGEGGRDWGKAALFVLISAIAGVAAGGGRRLARTRVTA